MVRRSPFAVGGRLLRGLRTVVLQGGLAGRVVVGCVIGCVGVGGVVGGCVVEEGPEGTTGLLGKIVFVTDTPLVFSSRLAVGSTFQIRIVPASDKVVVSTQATLTSDDDKVLTVTPVAGAAGSFDLITLAPGRVQLAVSDEGTDLDHVFVEAARAAATTLVDSAMLNASDAVDPRLPGRFGVIDDEPTRFLISALDKCGGPLLDLGASSVVVSGVGGVDPLTLATVTADGAAAFNITPVAVAGDSFLVQLVTPGIEPLDYEVDVVGRSDVNEVHAEVASVDTQASTARLWGRAFVNDIDVVGLNYDWSVDPRIALDQTTGAAVTASIAFGPDDAGVDLRPATVRAEVFGNIGTVDLLALQEGDLVQARGPVPERAGSDALAPTDSADASGSCTSCGGGGEACNALALAGAWGLRRRRRPRRPSA